MKMEEFFHNRCILSPEEQTKISEATIAVVGAGGLGGYVLNGLARLGARHIKIIDSDVFVPSNLNRQLYAYKQTVGKSKAISAAEALNNIPGCVPQAVEEELREDNAERILTGVGIIFDCADNIQTKLLLEKHCLKKTIPLFHGGVDRTYGQAAFILHKPLLAGFLNRASATENAVILPQLVSALQLQLFVKYIKNNNLSDIICYIDAEAMELFRIENSDS
jgi:molybdopterin/thiamine biosynthesis adenylyltransferase